MGRPRIHDEALRDRLLDLAAEAVSERGPHALSVRMLAKSAGTSTAAVYTLFGGMPGLVEELYARAFERLDAGQRGVHECEDPLEDLVEHARAYRATALEDPNGYRMMFGDYSGPALVSAELAARAARSFEPLVATVRRAVASATLPTEPDASAIATALWANSHGLVTVELGAFRPPAAVDPAAIFERSTRALLDGWSARA